MAGNFGLARATIPNGCPSFQLINGSGDLPAHSVDSCCEAVVRCLAMGDQVRPEWLKVGNQIRRLRHARRMSLDHLAAPLSITAGMLSAIERGIRGCKPEYAEEIDQALTTGGKVLRLVENMNSSPGLPEWFRDTERLQRLATEMRQFQLGLIPGLLQTEDYARVLLRAGEPTASEEEIEALVQARIDRQSLLWRDNPPRIFVVLEEGVLLRPVGGRGTMSCQLERLLSVSESAAHVVVQVVPMSTAPHPGLDGSFQLIKIPERDKVLVLETRFSGAPADDPEHVREYVQVFEDLRAMALPPVASRDLIRKVQGEFQ